MDIINPNFISAAFNCTKRKIYSNLAKTELEEISQDKNKKKKKRKEEKKRRRFYSVIFRLR